MSDVGSILDDYILVFLFSAGQEETKKGRASISLSDRGKFGPSPRSRTSREEIFLKCVTLFFRNLFFFVALWQKDEARAQHIHVTREKLTVRANLWLYNHLLAARGEHCDKCFGGLGGNRLLLASPANHNENRDHKKLWGFFRRLLESNMLRWEKFEKIFI